MTRSTLFAALAAGLVGAGVLGAATAAQAQYYFPNQPYYAPPGAYYGPPPGYGRPRGGYYAEPGYGPPPGYRQRAYRQGPPPVYYDKDTAKAVARNWKEQQKARIKSGYYNQPQYVAPQPRFNGYVGRPAPHDRGLYYAPPQNHY